MCIITVDVSTGEVSEVELTPVELADTISRTTAEAIPNKKNQIDLYCENKLSFGFTYGGAIFQINKASQDLIHARATRALAYKINPIAFPWESPHSDGWWDINNVILASTMTVDGFLAFARAVSDYCSACAKCCRGHKDAITSENCSTYDYSTGWPVN